MGKELDREIMQIKSSENTEQTNRLIEAYQPFVLNVITELKKSYVDVKNDEEFSVGLMAFYEALEKYNEVRGDFLSFARLVIQSRVKDYWAKKKENQTTELMENTIVEENFEERIILRREIEDFESVLKKFGLSFEQLAKNTPRHIETRERAKEIGKQAAKEDDLITHLYTKKRLPIAHISQRFKISRAIIKRSKMTITSTMIIIKENFSHIMEWIE